MFTYVFVTLSILQSQFIEKAFLWTVLRSDLIEKGFKKAENSEQNVMLLLFLFTLEIIRCALSRQGLVSLSLRIQMHWPPCRYLSCGRCSSSSSFSLSEWTVRWVTSFMYMTHWRRHLYFWLLVSSEFFNWNYYFEPNVVFTQYIY